MAAKTKTSDAPAPAALADVAATLKPATPSRALVLAALVGGVIAGINARRKPYDALDLSDMEGIVPILLPVADAIIAADKD